MDAGGENTINGEKKVLSPEDLILYRETFHSFDRDGDGTIDVSELHVAMRKLGHKKSDAELQRLILEVDADGNGSLEFSEFLDLLRVRMPEQSARRIEHQLQTVKEIEAHFSRSENMSKDQKRHIKNIPDVGPFKMCLPTRGKRSWQEVAAKLGEKVGYKVSSLTFSSQKDEGVEFFDKQYREVRVRAPKAWNTVVRQWMQNSDLRRKERMLKYLKMGTELMVSAESADLVTGATYLWELSINHECHEFMDSVVLSALCAALHASYHAAHDNGAGLAAATACATAVWSICDQNMCLGSELIGQGAIEGLAQLTTIFVYDQVSDAERVLVDRLAGAFATIVDHHEGIPLLCSAEGFAAMLRLMQCNSVVAAGAFCNCLYEGGAVPIEVAAVRLSSADVEHVAQEHDEDAADEEVEDSNTEDSNTPKKEKDPSTVTVLMRMIDAHCKKQAKAKTKTEKKAKQQQDGENNEVELNDVEMLTTTLASLCWLAGDVDVAAQLNNAKTVKSLLTLGLSLMEQGSDIARCSNSLHYTVFILLEITSMLRGSIKDEPWIDQRLFRFLLAVLALGKSKLLLPATGAIARLAHTAHLSTIMTVITPEEFICNVTDIISLDSPKLSICAYAALSGVCHSVVHGKQYRQALREQGFWSKLLVVVMSPQASRTVQLHAASVLMSLTAGNHDQRVGALKDEELAVFVQMLSSRHVEMLPFSCITVWLLAHDETNADRLVAMGVVNLLVGWVAATMLFGRYCAKVQIKDGETGVASAVGGAQSKDGEVNGPPPDEMEATKGDDAPDAAAWANDFFKHEFRQLKSEIVIWKCMLGALWMLCCRPTARPAMPLCAGITVLFDLFPKQDDRSRKDPHFGEILQLALSTIWAASELRANGELAASRSETLLSVASDSSQPPELSHLCCRFFLWLRSDPHISSTVVHIKQGEQDGLLQSLLALMCSCYHTGMVYAGESRTCGSFLSAL
jgi:hypothetical protein